MRDDAIGTDYQCYVRMSLFKSVYQSVYDSLKGGLDANTQQYISICPKVSVSFEAKYILWMLLAIVSNAWRAYQLLNMKDNFKDMTRTQIKKHLQNYTVRLTQFNYSLALDLIQVADEGCFIDRHPDPTVRNTSNAGFDFNPSTLQERLRNKEWPVRYKVKCFNRNKNFVKLRLMHNSNFVHKCTKIEDRRNHCTLCYDHQTAYGCQLCKVLLCQNGITRTQNGETVHQDSCFSIWHSKRDIEVVKKKSRTTKTDSLWTAHMTICKGRKSTANQLQEVCQ
jgi:hypothetical protein